MSHKTVSYIFLIGLSGLFLAHSWGKDKGSCLCSAPGEAGHWPGSLWASQSQLKMQVKLNLSRYVIVQPFSRTGVLKTIHCSLGGGLLGQK